MTILRVSYGLNAASDDDSLLSLFGETLEQIMGEGPPGACTVDLLSIRESSSCSVSVTASIPDDF